MVTTAVNTRSDDRGSNVRAVGDLSMLLTVICVLTIGGCNIPDAEPRITTTQLAYRVSLQNCRSELEHLLIHRDGRRLPPDYRRVPDIEALDKGAAVQYISSTNTVSLATADSYGDLSDEALYDTLVHEFRKRSTDYLPDTWDARLVLGPDTLRGRALLMDHIRAEIYRLPTEGCRGVLIILTSDVNEMTRLRRWLSDSITREPQSGIDTESR